MERGKALLGDQKYVRARIAFVHARDVCPGDAAALPWMELATVAAAAETPELVHDGNINEIDYVAAILLERFPEYRHLLKTAQGNVQARAGKNAEAVELYRAALEAKPDYVPAQYFQAQVLVAMKRSGDAEAVLRTATKTNRSHVPSQELLARMLAARGSLDEAQEILHQSIAANPAASTHVLLGDVARARHKPVDAAASFKAALDMKPDHAPALLALGGLLLDEGKAKEAAGLLAQYVEVAAQQGEPAARIADARRVLTQLQSAPAAEPPRVEDPARGTGKR
ncbi:MAG: tetratricopeptide repeat protein [Deltaproteobacteria bacterium]|nr:tetratricopeptide repeat protein [Deltaproteobacteria bacterium]